MAYQNRISIVGKRIAGCFVEKELGFFDDPTVGFSNFSIELEDGTTINIKSESPSVALCLNIEVPEDKKIYTKDKDETHSCER